MNAWSRLILKHDNCLLFQAPHVFLFPLVLISRVTYSDILANECPILGWESAYHNVHNIIQYGTIQYAVKHIHVCVCVCVCVGNLFRVEVEKCRKSLPQMTWWAFPELHPQCPTASMRLYRPNPTYRACVLQRLRSIWTTSHVYTQDIRNHGQSDYLSMRRSA